MHHEYDFNPPKEPRVTTSFSRRAFLGACGAAAAAAFLPRHISAQAVTSPFRISVINDEISQDFGHACEVAAHEFGMQWIELRGLGDKNIIDSDAQESVSA